MGQTTRLNIAIPASGDELTVKLFGRYIYIEDGPAFSTATVSLLAINRTRQFNYPLIPSMEFRFLDGPFQSITILGRGDSGTVSLFVADDPCIDYSPPKPSGSFPEFSRMYMAVVHISGTVDTLGYFTRDEDNLPNWVWTTIGQPLKSGSTLLYGDTDELGDRFFFVRANNTLGAFDLSGNDLGTLHTFSVAETGDPTSSGFNVSSMCIDRDNQRVYVSYTQNTPYRGGILSCDYSGGDVQNDLHESYSLASAGNLTGAAFNYAGGIYFLKNHLAGNYQFKLLTIATGVSEVVGTSLTITGNQYRASARKKNGMYASHNNGTLALETYDPATGSFVATLDASVGGWGVVGDWRNDKLYISDTSRQVERLDFDGGNREVCGGPTGVPGSFCRGLSTGY